MKPNTFLEDPEFSDQQIWDLKYISTSNEEDNDSSDESGSSDEEECGDEEKKVDSSKDTKKVEQTLGEKLDPEGKVDPKKIWKL
jgi:hypothetical protein